MSDEMSCSMSTACPVDGVLEGLFSLVVADKMGVLVKSDTDGEQNRKRKRGSGVRWASWRGKFSMRCRNPEYMVRGVRRVASGIQTRKNEYADDVMKTSQCGTVSTEVLPVCSVSNSMERVNCTSVQVMVKQTGQCGTVRSGVVPVCGMDISSGVQTTSDTFCYKQERYTIDKELIGSGVLDSGVCIVEKGENTRNNFYHGHTAIGEHQLQKVQSEAKNGLESGNVNRRTPPACGSRRKLVAKRMGARNVKKVKEVPDRFQQLEISQFFINKIPAEKITHTGGIFEAVGIAEHLAGSLKKFGWDNRWGYKENKAM
jgi:hypothetical protein